jgi:hypothetical protein
MATAWLSGVADQRSDGQEPVSTPDGAATRNLTYAVGSTIHYGERSIDVGEEVQFLAVTDDGVAFVREPDNAQPGDKPVWFTSGNTVERIGTTFGSPARGYLVEASDSGSMLVVRRDGGPGPGRPSFDVIDTSTGNVIHRESAGFGDTFELLGVHDDAIYWVYPRESSCTLAGEAGCLRFRRVTGYDVATDSVVSVSWARYDEEVRSKARMIVGPDPGSPPVPGTFPLDPVFDRQGTDLVARDNDGGRELALNEARTGDPIRLQVPAGASEATRFELSQWLDDDRFVLFGYTEPLTEYANEGDMFVCALSTGDCRLQLRGRPGTPYQLPALD